MSTCLACSLPFEPWNLSGKGVLNKKFCKNCKLPNGKALFVVVCKYCRLSSRHVSAGKTLFCSKSCKNKWEHANGIRVIGFDNTKTNYQKWVERFGQEIADQKMIVYKQTMSVAIQNADMSLQKQRTSEITSERNRSNAGKTYEEIYGLERALQMKKNCSLRSQGEKNPAFGKVYANGGKSVKGHYKGFFFRSLLEYSFMKHLEGQGFDLKNDVKYECFRVPYMLNDRNRTYTIDFYVEREKTVYEVKPSYALKNDANQCKFEAAKLFFQKTEIKFCVMTENEFKKITFKEARQDSDVVWKKETFEYFRKDE